MRKIELPVDKRAWPLGIIPGPITLISTIDKNSEPNIAPISWIQMVSFEPSILMFSGSKDSATVKNILKTGSFAVNLANSAIAGNVIRCTTWHGRERIERSGFEFEKAIAINAPLVKGCRANLECKLLDTWGKTGTVVVFGEIVAAAIDEEILKVDKTEQYRLLDLILYLEDGLFGRLGDVTKVRDI